MCWEWHWCEQSPCWKTVSIWPSAFQRGSSRPSSSTGGPVGMGKTLSPTSTPQHIFFSRLLFLKFILNWRIIALQCCVAVQPCESAISVHTSPPSWPSFPALPFHPLGHHRAWSWVLCYASISCQLSILHMDICNICLFYFLRFSAPPFSYCVHKSVPYVWISILALEKGSSVPSF